jgi:hypothetical protein
MRQQNVVISTAELGPELRWRRPAAIVNDIPILSSERMLHKSYNRKCSVGEKFTGRESKGACRQDELTVCKPSIVK